MDNTKNKNKHFKMNENDKIKETYVETYVVKGKSTPEPGFIKQIEKWIEESKENLKRSINNEEKIETRRERRKKPKMYL